MNSVTYTEVQELISRLPAKKLPIAYEFLARLTDEESTEQSIQVKFLSLSLKERRRLLAQQAEELLETSHYQETAAEREEWQGGDFSEY
jgi:hypothetical protein